MLAVFGLVTKITLGRSKSLSVALTLRWLLTCANARTAQGQELRLRGLFVRHCRQPPFQLQSRRRRQRLQAVL